MKPVRAASSGVREDLLRLVFRSPKGIDAVTLLEFVGKILADEESVAISLGILHGQCAVGCWWSIKPSPSRETNG